VDMFEFTLFNFSTLTSSYYWTCKKEHIATKYVIIFVIFIFYLIYTYLLDKSEVLLNVL
jgi:hypothetical protein